MLHPTPIISFFDVCKSFQPQVTSPVLESIFLKIFAGESCAILGTSGSGKSTLLNIMGLLDVPNSGAYQLVGQNVYDLAPDRIAAIRNLYLGFVFQSFNLLPDLSALDNVALPLNYRGLARQEALSRARQWLEHVGLGKRVDDYPADLSGGQRQRVAIARALVGNPSVVLADEPTGNLDHDTAEEIIDLLLRLNREHKVTLVIVTHDRAIARRMGRQIVVQDGVVLEHRDSCNAH